MAELQSTAKDPRRDFIRETPRNPVLGYLSDLAGSTYSPERTQQMQGVAQFFGAPAISQTLNRMAYGEPMTTGAGGIGGTSRIRPEVADAAMSVMDLLPTGGLSKGAALAAPMIGGMFVGKKSVTWDALAAAKAKILTDMGTDPRTIWKETGTWKGSDGKWRQEIDGGPSLNMATAPDNKIVAPPEKTLRIYRGSHVENPEYSVEENYGNNIYGGVFGSSNIDAARSHGSGAVHFTDIPENKILTHYDLNYEIPYEQTKNALLKARPDLKNNQELFDELYDVVVGDAGQDLSKFDEDKILDLLRESGSEAQNEAQKLRGKVAKNLGYKAVEMTDEHGSGTYLVVPGARFKSAEQ
jgi:hypothetical protein